jgi:hypothetical protein
MGDFSALYNILLHDANAATDVAIGDMFGSNK